MSVEEKLDIFWSEHHQFEDQLAQLRSILVDCGLTETYKWRFPTYTLDAKNVVSIGAFKEHYALWFFQGVFLKDEMKVLSNAQDGKTKAMRHWKFRKQEKIDIDLVKTYVLESIDNHKNGKEVIVKIDTTYETPPLLLDALNNNDSLNSSFYGLTPGRQKEYANYITEAKQDTTKQKRLIKITPMILEGKGLHDKYRKC
ncbi:MAG: YdeI/OmpD-associated family protein [Bacteroidia bacterium]